MKLHFIGIGGIGMSGLAAMCRDAGHQISGSDRGAGLPENRHIFSKLERQGITVYPQDGSYINGGKPDYLVYSSAIEEDNPDFVSGPDIPRLHRSELLEKVISDLSEDHLSIAVSGSCGKSTVTAYLAEALYNLGLDPKCLDGGLVKRFVTEQMAGNYHPGKGKFLVFEADESDKSLLRYHPDYALLLNIGTDHYSSEELVRVFGTFLQQVRKGAVLSREVYRMITGSGYDLSHLQITVFETVTGTSASHFVRNYGWNDLDGSRQFHAVLQPFGELILPQMGYHTAINALSCGAMLQMLGVDPLKITAALSRFDGVSRRCDLAGFSDCGCAVYDDYAHNPEKIRSCLRGMRESSVTGRILAVFQPHGYGPFGFMQSTLFDYLESDLQSGDIFILLEPFYAGGTSSFSPHSIDVTCTWQKNSRHPETYIFAPDRESAALLIQENCRRGDVIAVMGARDNSLGDFARRLAGK